MTNPILPTKEELKEQIEGLTPDERVQLVNTLCNTVNTLSQAIVENAEAIWNSGGQ